MITVKISFDDDKINPAIQEHLAGGVSVRQYIESAVHFFNDCRKYEAEKKIIGAVTKNRYNSYELDAELKTQDYM